jgi:hypothetical protein
VYVYICVCMQENRVNKAPKTIKSGG